MNPNTLARCIPGCESITPAGPDRYLIAGSVGIAFLRKQYRATFGFTETDPPHSCHIVISNADDRRAEPVAVRVTLKPAGAGAILRASALIPNAGGGIANAGAERMIRQFFERLADHI